MTLSVLLLALALIQATSDVAGSWRLSVYRFGEETGANPLELRVDENRVTGTLNQMTIGGTLQGARVTWVATRPNGSVYGTFDAEVSGNEMRGTLHREGQDVQWIARRTTISAAPQTRTFEPTVFSRVFSGAVAPALHVNPGDTIRTTTLDANGRDAANVERANEGNPQTGPFYVDGAMPGDTLAVTLNRIRLNRDHATSGTFLTVDGVSAKYVRDTVYDAKFSGEWKLDRERGVATLANPPERLKDFRVNLRPFLGCIAVAPFDRQAFQALWLGAWGGNLDYSGLREGTTVYLPVFQPGALLFIGDGHAAQGDGELTLSALETSMDVELTVNVLHGQSSTGPTAENDHYLMAMGIAGSLPDALRQATTALARWLERDYHLAPNETAIVLGTSIQYDIAEIADPLVNVVAKISKGVLAQVRR